ncbi:MAG: radical SAM family heme chaperone HemW [Cytophagaceae bacterium]|nr:radical SAM family heme chaperone HemW [Cytophagaceae bacterium]MDW8457113.1 radical SAM family heme chaperone HemW [Cytophagaceae bacterium]
MALAGLYIHIPFCSVACHYCDFHFSTSLHSIDALVECIAEEMFLQKNYLPSPEIETVYLGGGTPSLLKKHHMDVLFNAIHKNFKLLPQAEITLEANPDDITKEKLSLWKNYDINRLSIGVQSFHDDELKYLNRIHTSKQNYQSVGMAQDAGFQNISIDLIYGIPLEKNHNKLQQSLRSALELNVQHISAYCLTIEPDTVFGRWLHSGKISAADDTFQAEQFVLIQNTLLQQHYEQYEISNYAKPHYISKHNSNYWLDRPYLGVGPSAHSYNLHSRQYNIANNELYIRQVKQHIIPAQIELCTNTSKYNDYILTRLRTKWGIDANEITKKFGIHFELINKKKIEEFMSEKMISFDENVYRLTKEGMLIADHITRAFFIV